MSCFVINGLLVVRGLIRVLCTPIRVQRLLPRCVFVLYDKAIISVYSGFCQCYAGSTADKDDLDFKQTYFFPGIYENIRPIFSVFSKNPKHFDRYGWFNLELAMGA